MEVLIEEFVAEYGTQIWLTFVTFVITGFLIASARNLITDIIYYINARFSDIGYGQTILYRGKPYTVSRITFKHIIIHDVDEVIRVPIKVYMNGPIHFPKKPY